MVHGDKIAVALRLCGQLRLWLLFRGLYLHKQMRIMVRRASKPRSISRSCQLQMLGLRHCSSFPWIQDVLSFIVRLRSITFIMAFPVDFMLVRFCSNAVFQPSINLIIHPLQNSWNFQARIAIFGMFPFYYYYFFSVSTQSISIGQAWPANRELFLRLSTGSELKPCQNAIAWPLSMLCTMYFDRSG